MNPRFLYKGYVPPLIGMGFEKAIVFGTYHNALKSMPASYSREKSIALSGGLSGMAASFIVAPYERLKI